MGVGIVGLCREWEGMGILGLGLLFPEIPDFAVDIAS